jgi:hypothetical protein
MRHNEELYRPSLLFLDVTSPKMKSQFQRLEVLIGEWSMEASVANQPVARGKVAFDWLEGRAFVVQHVTADPPLPTTPPLWRANSPFPIVTVIGLDEASGLFSFLYADARGVRRVYRMSLEDGVWSISGQAGPAFFQRFQGAFSNGDRSITAYWDRSEDNQNWERDFDVKYTKIR